MTNNKTWIDQIAEVINDENRVTEKRVTATLEKLATQYKNTQNVMAKSEYLQNKQWKVQLKEEIRVFNWNDLTVKIGDLQNDEELEEVLQDDLVNLFINH